MNKLKKKTRNWILYLIIPLIVVIWMIIGYFGMYREYGRLITFTILVFLITYYFTLMIKKEWG